MNARDSAKTSDAPLTQDVLYALRYYLGGRRGLIVLAIVAAVAGLAFNWGWLVAIGVAPILLALAPCAAMCALGLCMNKMGSSSSETTSQTNAASAGTKLSWMREQNLAAALPELPAANRNAADTEIDDEPDGRGRASASSCCSSTATKRK